MKDLTFISKDLERKANLLKELIKDGGKFSSVEIIADTSVSLKPKKEGCPYTAKDKVKSLKEYSANLNGNYYNMVINRKAKENKDKNYEVKKPWFTRLYDTKNGSIVVKTSEIEKNKPISEIYLFIATKYAKNVSYSIGGKQATNEEIKTIKAFKKDRKVEASKSQGLSLENALIVSTIKSENIRQIRANKQIVNF